MIVRVQNTGRWTYGEHCLFLKGLEQHGKGWKKIASLIRTRTVVQIRTHAQKYFQKLAKAKQNGDHGDVGMDSKGGGKRKHRNKRKVIHHSYILVYTFVHVVKLADTVYNFTVMQPTAVVHYSSLATAAYASHNHVLLLRIVEVKAIIAC
jgi:SHAQKYF class myb-like DNA-binding protein